jgi:TetR/AcrR family transcriptional regulator, ethionamide resistance regulator
VRSKTKSRAKMERGSLLADIVVADRAAIAPEGKTERRNAVSRKPQSPATKRGSKTREHIKSSAARVLERIGYRAMILSDIAKEANVNVSLVYHYFSGKADITHEILSDLIERRSVERGEVDVSDKDPFEAILAANRSVVELYVNTPGLMRCLVHFDEEEEEFSQIFRRVSLEWNRKVARNIARRCPNSKMSDGQRLIVAYALGGMADNFMFELFVDRNPLVKAELPTAEEAARFLSILWYRALYAENPPEEKLHTFSAFADLKLSN